VNTAIAITAIIAATLLVNSIVVAIRDVRTARHQAGANSARALHRKANNGETCVYCAPMQRIGYDTTWPCDTIRALDGLPIKENNE
jgi:hypothetical protein